MGGVNNSSLFTTPMELIPEILSTLVNSNVAAVALTAEKLVVGVFFRLTAHTANFGHRFQNPLTVKETEESGDETEDRNVDSTAW